LGLLPELSPDLDGVDADRLPPTEFAPRAVEFPVVGSTDGTVRFGPLNK